MKLLSPTTLAALSLMMASSEAFSPPGQMKCRPVKQRFATTAPPEDAVEGAEQPLLEGDVDAPFYADDSSMVVSPEAITRAAIFAEDNWWIGPVEKKHLPTDSMPRPKIVTTGLDGTWWNRASPSATGFRPRQSTFRFRDESEEE